MVTTKFLLAMSSCKVDDISMAVACRIGGILFRNIDNIAPGSRCVFCEYMYLTGRQVIMKADAIRMPFVVPTTIIFFVSLSLFRGHLFALGRGLPDRGH